MVLCLYNSLLNKIYLSITKQAKQPEKVACVFMKAFLTYSMYQHQRRITMTFKKIISIVLTFVIMLSLIPYSASAAPWGEGDTLEFPTSEFPVGFHNTRLDWLILDGIGTPGDIIMQRYTYFNFKDSNGDLRVTPIYCIDPNLGGAYELVNYPERGGVTDGNGHAMYVRGNLNILR